MKDIYLDLKDSTIKILLQKEAYSLWIIGGFGIDLNGFEVIITDSENKKIFIKEKFFKQQECIKGERAKKLYEFEINQNAEYNITFKNSENIVVYYSNLFLAKFISKKIKNEKLKFLVRSN